MIKLEKALTDYINELRNFKDDPKRLYENLYVHDNFEIGFYGNSESILSTIVDAFSNSPQEMGLSLKWELLYHCKKGEITYGRPEYYDIWSFKDNEDRVTAEIKKLTSPYCPRKLLDLELTEALIMLHPPLSRKWKDKEEYIQKMALPLLDICEFIVKAKIPSVIGKAKVYHFP